MVNEQPGEMPTTPAVEEPKDAPKEEPKADTASSATPSATEVELEKTREALKKANKEAAERRKRLDELEKAEADRAAAAMTETERKEARIKELETAKQEIESKLKQREYADLQTKVAKAVSKELGIPYELVETIADRLRGETEEELTDDAKKIFAVLPKPQEEPQKKAAPKLEPTNPGNGVQGETLEQRKQRLRGDNKSKMYDPTWVSNNGGGASFVEK